MSAIILKQTLEAVEAQAKELRRRLNFLELPDPDTLNTATAQATNALTVLSIVQMIFDHTGKRIP